MKKQITIFFLTVMFVGMAFRPTDQALLEVYTATVTPDGEPAAKVVDPLPEGMEFWCLPVDVPYVKDPAAVQKSDLAVDVKYGEDGFTLRGPFSVCYIQLPAESQYDDAVISFFDLSKGPAWYTCNLSKNGTGLIAVLTHQYLVDPPFWRLHYSIEIQADDGPVLFFSPLLYDRKWKADLCWNGNMPDPVTFRCPLQLDLHPWDAGYGKPLPTVKPIK
jgi:hypothetical protein